MRSTRRPGTMTMEAAEEMAGRVLLFLAEDSGRLGRFLGETGLDPAELRANMRERATLAAVVGYLLADESALLAFSANAGVKPEDVAKAEFALGGGSPWDST